MSVAPFFMLKAVSDNKKPAIYARTELIALGIVGLFTTIQVLTCERGLMKRFRVGEK